MEIPDLVQGELGDEEVRAGVTLGDDDAVCFTATRTLVYRGEGLLSDEKVETYPYDFERLKLSEGRRKTKLTLFYTDQKRELGVPGSRAGAVLERLLEGKLRSSNAIGETESVNGVFRFSELTLVITDNRMLKHLGSVTWDDDFDTYAFADVTGLDFEEGSVATAIVLSIDDRPERIKAPNEQAASVRKTLEESLFAFHEVSSLTDLNAKVASEPDEGADDGVSLGLESDIDPLVSEESDDSADQQTAAAATTAPASTSSPSGSAATETPDGDIAELERQVADLTAAVEQQSERIQKQEETIKTLIKELRQGR